MGNQNNSSVNQQQNQISNTVNNQKDLKTYYDIDENLKNLAYNLEEEILSKFCSELTRE